MQSKKEDYLRAIFEIHNENGVRLVDVAKQLGIKKPSAHEMINKLIAEDFVKKDPYSKLFLTKKGKKHAAKCKEKHQIIKEFITKTLKHKESEAHTEAHKLEHAFSDESVRRMKRILTQRKIERSAPEREIAPNYVG